MYHEYLYQRMMSLLFKVLMLIIQMEKSTVFNSLLVCCQTVNSTEYAMRVNFLSMVKLDYMMSHDVRYYMKYSTVFSPVNTEYYMTNCKNYSFADAQTVARVFIYNIVCHILKIKF